MKKMSKIVIIEHNKGNTKALNSLNTTVTSNHYNYKSLDALKTEIETERVRIMILLQ